jgi:hypothetical protein
MLGRPKYRAANRPTALIAAVMPISVAVRMQSIHGGDDTAASRDPGWDPTRGADGINRIDEIGLSRHTFQSCTSRAVHAGRQSDCFEGA